MLFAHKVVVRGCCGKRSARTRPSSEWPRVAQARAPNKSEYRKCQTFLAFEWDLLGYMTCRATQDRGQEKTKFAINSFNPPPPPHPRNVARARSTIEFRVQGAGGRTCDKGEEDHRVGDGENRGEQSLDNGLERLGFLEKADGAEHAHSPD